MNKEKMYMLLNMIEKYSSIINLIKLGYSYTDVINYYKELTEKDLIKYKKKYIFPLEKYKIPKIKLDSIYLP